MFWCEVFRSEIGLNMRVLRFLGRILKRALADIGKAANDTAGSGSNKIDKLHGGGTGTPGGPMG